MDESDSGVSKNKRGDYYDIDAEEDPNEDKELKPIDQPNSENEDTLIEEKPRTQESKGATPAKYPNIQIGNLVNNRWKIIELLGSGGFGAVYKVIANGRKGQIEAAMKIEGTNKWRVEMFRDSKDLKLRRLMNCPEESLIRLTGKDMRATQLSLKKQVFSLSTTIRASMQTLEALRSLYQIGFLHRDIKPQNFAIGIGKENRTVFMLDFGLARRFIDAEGQYLTARVKCNFRGTPYYASINVHKGQEQGPHDDIWSWFYMMIDFYHGILPWASATYDTISDVKEQVNPIKLIGSLPQELLPIHKHLTNLKYPIVPKYPKIVYCLEQIIERFQIKESEAYDWEVTDDKQSSQSDKENTPKSIRGPNPAVMK